MKIYLKDEDQWKLYEGESLKDALVKRKINIGRGVQIGSYVRIGSYVQIDSDVRIGRGVQIGRGVLKINSLGREPYRQFSQSMQWHPKRGLLIQAGCRIFNISQAREHWSAAQYENREIGDYYLRLIDYIETEAKALGWVKITEMIQEPQK